MYERELAYLKSLISPSYSVQFSPSGMYCPYEAGYILMALIQKGEYDLAKECLDELATIQHTYAWNGYTIGAWYQMYYPYTKGLVLRGSYERYKFDEKSREIDSAIAMPALAMAFYDDKKGTTIYKTTVQRAIGFLKRILQDPETGGVWNQRVVPDGVVEKCMFSADMAEILLALRYALDAYGTIDDSTGYSMTTFGEEIASFLETKTWTGPPKYWQTEYPLGAESAGLKQFKQRLTFTQAITAWAMYRWDAGYAYLCRFALDLVNQTMTGNDGGYYEFPTFTDEDVKRGGLYQYAVYTAFMVIAMKVVEKARYQRLINRGLSFIRMMTTQRGEVYNYLDHENAKGIWVPMATYFTGIVRKPLIPTGFVGYHTACKILAETF